MIPTKFRFIWPSGFRGEEFKKSANQKQESPVAAMFVNESGQNVQSFIIFHFLLKLFTFLAHLAKGKVSFCHHLASVVLRPLSVVQLSFS
jgi:hypothetical protein